MRRSKHNFGELLLWLSPSTIRDLGIKLRLLGKGSMDLYSLRQFTEPEISFKVMNNGVGDSIENMPIPVWGPLWHDKHVLGHGRTWEVSFSPSSNWLRTFPAVVSYLSPQAHMLPWSSVSAPAVGGQVSSVLLIIHGCCWRTGWVSQQALPSFLLHASPSFQNIFTTHLVLWSGLFVNPLCFMIKLIPKLVIRKAWSRRRGWSLITVDLVVRQEALGLISNATKYNSLGIARNSLVQFKVQFSENLLETNYGFLPHWWIWEVWRVWANKLSGWCWETLKFENCPGLFISPFFIQAALETHLPYHGQTLCYCLKIRVCVCMNVCMNVCIDCICVCGCADGG